MTSTPVPRWASGIVATLALVGATTGLAGTDRTLSEIFWAVVFASGLLSGAAAAGFRLIRVERQESQT